MTLVPNVVETYLKLSAQIAVMKVRWYISASSPTVDKMHGGREQQNDKRANDKREDRSL